MRGRGLTLVAGALAIMALTVLLIYGIAYSMSAAGLSVKKGSYKISGQRVPERLEVYVYNQNLCDLLYNMSGYRRNVATGSFKVLVVNTGGTEVETDHAALLAKVDSEYLVDEGPFKRSLMPGDAVRVNFLEHKVNSLYPLPLRVVIHTRSGGVYSSEFRPPDPFMVVDLQGNSCTEP